MIAILTATMNRSDVVIRALRYYKRIGFQGWFCIGDSGDLERARKVQCVVREMEGDLDEGVMRD